MKMVIFVLPANIANKTSRGHGNFPPGNVLILDGNSEYPYYTHAYKLVKVVGGKFLFY